MNRNNVVRLSESKLRNMIKESVKRVLKEEIGDGSFPNSEALIGHSIERIEQALSKEGFKMDEYGDDSNGNGVVYFTNEDGITVTVSYPWVKTRMRSYKAGKIKTADVY